MDDAAARIQRDLAYASHVRQWALSHLDRADLTPKQRRLIERELRTAQWIHSRLSAQVEAPGPDRAAT
jgi:hypothetical protein